MSETKEHILKTSLLLFLQKSYKDVTMREIVEKSGLSKGAFYHYFSSKEELFKEIAYLFFSSGVIDYTKFPQTSLKDFYMFYVKYISESLLQMQNMIGKENPEKTSLNVFFILFEAAARFPEFLDFELKQYNKSVKVWKKLIKHAKDTREIVSKSSDKMIADLFLYCTDGVFLRYVNSENKTSYAKDLLKAFNTIYLNLKV